jgi:hypothetical protein
LWHSRASRGREHPTKKKKLLFNLKKMKILQNKEKKLAHASFTPDTWGGGVFDNGYRTVKEEKEIFCLVVADRMFFNEDEAYDYSLQTSFPVFICETQELANEKITEFQQMLEHGCFD